MYITAAMNLPVPFSLEAEVAEQLGDDAIAVNRFLLNTADQIPIRVEEPCVFACVSTCLVQPVLV